jgi:hypothetical protein
MTADPFTLRRLTRFAETFRATKALLPTLKDFEEAGFGKELVDQAVKKELLVELYVNLTSGAVVKGYKKKD